MTVSVIEAKRTMRSLAAKAAIVVASKSLSVAQQKTALSHIEIELKAAAGAIKIHEQANLLMIGGESLAGGFDSALATGRAMKGLATPSLALAPEQLQFVTSPVNQINTNGTIVYQGPSLGLEWLW